MVQVLKLVILGLKLLKMTQISIVSLYKKFLVSFLIAKYPVSGPSKLDINFDCSPPSRSLTKDQTNCNAQLEYITVNNISTIGKFTPIQESKRSNHVEIVSKKR